MSLAHLVLSFSPPCYYRNGFAEDRKAVSGAASTIFIAGIGNARDFLRFSPFWVRGSNLRDVVGRGRLNLADSHTVEHGGQIRTGVEIPVTCYQVVGVPDKAEKDEIVKAVMELKNAEIEEGYTLDVVASRQDLLVDVRDKLLFEPEYAGNVREKVPPKSSLRIPWAWLPGALCLLQEVGEEKLVLEIGQAALHHQDAKSFVHDLLLSMALAECSIAKTSFEKNKVSQGFEALARAQYLLKSKISLGNMPLLSQIEESLEELAPACTLELLTLPHTPENSERRRGAIAALRELLRQGLEVETSCRVQDWSCFLSQALSKLLATEIVDLLPWDNLTIIRKNKKSLESQNQKIVIDFNCFYMVMLAHIALGFSSRQSALINKAKDICECLVASEGIDLKFEEALCSFLLGQGDEAMAAERLRQLEINGSPVSQSFKANAATKEVNGSANVSQSLEIWLKDAVLGVFPDTRDCSPSLVNFFKGEKRILGGNKQKKGTTPIIPSVTRRASEEPLYHMNSTRHLGAAVKQLAPDSLQNQLTLGKGSGNSPVPSVHLKRNLGLHHKKIWESWWTLSDVMGRIIVVTVMGCLVVTTFKLLQMRLGHRKSPSMLYSTKTRANTSSRVLAMDQSPGYKLGPAHIGGNNIVGRLGELLAMFKKQLKHPAAEESLQNSWPVEDLSSLSNVLQKRQMSLEEAETLVRQWQDIKAEALGPDHEVLSLSEVLDESMLSQWQALAESAKARSCFWRFVLLSMSILRAEVVSDGNGCEMAEIDALLEEAAELVEESQTKNPNYYSTYKIRYFLKKQDDGSWKFCRGGVETPA